MNWEEVKSLPDEKILVYHINGTIKLLPGVCREINHAANVLHDYDFVQLVDSQIIGAYKKEELLFWSKE